MPRYLFVVARHEPALFALLQERFAGDETLEVVLDRRERPTSPPTIAIGLVLLGSWAGTGVMRWLGVRYGWFTTSTSWRPWGSSTPPETLPDHRGGSRDVRAQIGPHHET